MDLKRALSIASRVAALLVLVVVLLGTTPFVNYGAGGTPATATVLVASGNSNSSNVTWADATGLTVSVTSGVQYTFVCSIGYTTASTNTAIHLAVNGPTTTALTYLAVANISGSGTNVTRGGVQTAYDTVTNPGFGGGATANSAYVAGLIIPSADGTLAIRVKSEVNLSAVNVLAGSWCSVR
jgi:hypothetical protein